MSSPLDIADAQDRVRVARAWVVHARDELARLELAWYALADEVAWQSSAALRFRSRADEAALEVRQAVAAADAYQEELDRSISLVAGTGGCP